MIARTKVIIWLDLKLSTKSSLRILLPSPKETKDKKIMEMLKMYATVGNQTA